MLIAITDGEFVEGHFHITWGVTRSCNLRCSYCSAENRKSVPTVNPMEICSNIVKLRPRWKTLSVLLHGGEPTYRTPFMEIVDALLSAGISVSTISNFTAPPRVYQDCVSRGVHFCLSCHASYLPYYRKKALAMQPSMNLRFKLCLSKNRQEEMLKFYDELRAAGHLAEIFYVTESTPMDAAKSLLALKTIENDTTYRKCRLHYDDGSTKEFYSEELMRFHMNRFYGWRCSAGLYSCYAESDGIVYPCDGMYFPIGTLLGNEPHIDLGETRCYETRCQHTDQVSYDKTVLGTPFPDLRKYLERKEWLEGNRGGTQAHAYKDQSKSEGKDRLGESTKRCAFSYSANSGV